MLLAFSIWPAGERIPRAWATPVVVQDVGTSDPEGSVMVYSSPDYGVTVIWLFPSQPPAGS